MASKLFQQHSQPGKKNPGFSIGTTLSCSSGSSTSRVSPSSSSKGATSPNLDHLVMVLMDQQRCPPPLLWLPWSSQKLLQARPAMANVIAVVVKVTRHATAPKRTPVVAKVGSPRVVTRSGRLKHLNPISRKGLMKTRKGRARQRRKRTSSLTGLSKLGLTDGLTWIKRT
jgi:hypothetical protein